MGRAAQQDVFKAQTQYAIFEAQLLRYRQERESKEIEINQLLNRPPSGLIEVPDDIPPGELTATLDDLLAHARKDAPRLAREQKMVERGELAANLARRSAYPDYTLSGCYFNQGGLPPMWQFRVDFKVPTHFWSKQNAEITEQAYRTAEARHNYEATDLAIQAQIREQYTIATTRAASSTSTRSRSCRARN